MLYLLQVQTEPPEVCECKVLQALHRYSGWVSTMYGEHPSAHLSWLYRNWVQVHGLAVCITSTLLGYQASDFSCNPYSVMCACASWGLSVTLQWSKCWVSCFSEYFLSMCYRTSLYEVGLLTALVVNPKGGLTPTLLFIYMKASLFLYFNSKNFHLDKYHTV